MASITNQASVSFSYEGSDVTRSNDSNVVTSTMKDKYAISVEKTTTSDCFRPGDTLTYFIHVTNIGCNCLGSFEICDNLGGEEYLTYVEGSARLFNSSMVEVTPTSVSPLCFELTNKLERDEEFFLQYSVTVSEDIPSDVESITNEVVVRARACGCGCDSKCRECVEETATATIEKCEYAEVLITKSVSDETYCCGDELEYFITLTNTGNVDATEVVVTDSLPEDFTAEEIHMENNGNHYKFDPSEYTIDDANFLTLPNETGTKILVPALVPGTDNTTRIRIHGHM